MDVSTWAEIQEGILYAFGPVFFWFLVVLVVGTILTAIGAVMLEIVSRMTG